MPKGYAIRTSPLRPDLEPTKVPSALDVAWATGIYEGEGTTHERRYAAAEIHVTQKDPEILYQLRDWFGGNVRFARCSTIKPEHQCYRWSVCGDRARMFVAQIYSRLSVRRKAQIDATHTLAFLAGADPSTLSLGQLKEKLELFREANLGTSPSAIQRRKKKQFQGNPPSLPFGTEAGGINERVM